MATKITDEYVDGIEYTRNYFGELNPVKARYIFTHLGLAFPKVGTACELGFGQGVSVNMHAAASVTQWYGTDFNSQHLAFAQKIANAYEKPAQLFDQAFEQFCQRSDLPDFDLIALHGIWSWVSHENHQIILDFINKKLKLGGVVYISYNTQLGHLKEMPLRDLWLQHSQRISPSGMDIKQRINDALQFTEKLMQLDSVFVKQNPWSKNYVEKLKSRSREYIAHEYFNGHWFLNSFGEMANQLSNAQLQYGGSANYYDNLLSTRLPKEQTQFLQAIADPIFKEVVFDLLSNNGFRKDYWVKGLKATTPETRAELLRAQRFVRIQPPGEFSYQVNTGTRVINMNRDFYGRMIDAFSDFQPKSLLALEALFQGEGTSFNSIADACFVLCGANLIEAVQSDEQINQAKANTEKLNRYLLAQAKHNRELNYLASPLTGGGFLVPHGHRLFLLAILEGDSAEPVTPTSLAQFVWTILSAKNQKVIKQGQVLQTPEENLAELSEQAQKFADDYLPLYRGLQII